MESDRLYETFLREYLVKKNLASFVVFVGPRSNHEILPYLREAHVFANMSRTGSLDKAMLEAMAVGTPVVSCNEAIEGVFGEYAVKLMYPTGDGTALAERLRSIEEMPFEEYQRFAEALRGIVVEHHQVDTLMAKIVQQG